jgi:tryptophan-rich sensory protein
MSKSPPLTPPTAVFPAVWIALFALMAIGVGRVYLAPPSPDRSRAIRTYWVQLAFNFVWSILFFNLRLYGFALLWLLILWGLILWMLLSFRKVIAWTAWLQLPYLLWVAFAAYLNLGVWYLNP